MFENKNEENVVEQTFESDKNTVSEVSVEDAPTISTDNLEPNKDYLDPTLFDDVKVIEIDEINSQIPELISEIEGKLRIFSSSKYVISKS